MKWNEMTTVQKIMSVVGWICGIVFIILTVIDLFAPLPIPKAAIFSLYAVFWVGMGITQSSRKLAKWYYGIAAGFAFLALLYIFF